MLAVKDITLNYLKQTILDKVSLTFPDRQITVLVGANGCGKSTLLKALARQLKPTTGQVYLDDQPLYAMSAKKVAQQIALLAQSAHVTENITVSQLLRYGRYPWQHFMSHWSQQDEAYLQKAMTLTQTRELAHRLLNDLSGGQRQRVWIAMTLVQNTPYLLLDEPTTYLDLNYQIEILNLVKMLNEQEGKTVIMVLHDLNLASRYAHHMVMLKDKGVYLTGTPQHVMTAEHIQAVFHLACQVRHDPIYHTPLCIPY